MTVTVTALLVDPPTVAVALGTNWALTVCLPTVVPVQLKVATFLDTATVLAVLPSTTNLTLPTGCALVSKDTVAVNVTTLPFFTVAADAFRFVVDTALTTVTVTAAEVAPAAVAPSDGTNCAVMLCLPTFAVCDSFTDALPETTGTVASTVEPSVNRT